MTASTFFEYLTLFGLGGAGYTAILNTARTKTGNRTRIDFFTIDRFKNEEIPSQNIILFRANLNSQYIFPIVGANPSLGMV